MKHIRKRITYANVMSSIAVFLVLGGATAYAAKKIGSNEIKGNSITTGKIKKQAVTSSKIKNNAITTAKIANGAVTGAKLNLGTIGAVPNALHANSADNANTVGGQSATKIFAKLADGAGTTTIATIAGFTITAACPAGGANEIDIQLHSPNVPSVETANLSEGLAGTGGDTEYDAGNPATIDLDNDFLGETAFSGATTNGTVVSGNIGYDYPNTFVGEDICVVYGEAFSG